jgi:hypothetical protein
MTQPTPRLIRFYDALTGADRHGTGTCDICGRDGVETVISSMGLRRVVLCWPCFAEDMEYQWQVEGGE